mgnify:FL=1
MRLTRALLHDMLGIVLLLTLDQVSKYFVQVWGFHYVLNQGSVAGIGRGLGIQGWWWAIPSLMILTLLWRSCNLWGCNMTFRIARVLLSAGIVGNLVDRIYHDAVLDFIDISIGSFHWPTFNFADIYLIMGVFLVLSTLVSKKHV